MTSIYPQHVPRLSNNSIPESSLLDIDGFESLIDNYNGYTFTSEVSPTTAANTITTFKKPYSNNDCNTNYKENNKISSSIVSKYKTKPFATKVRPEKMSDTLNKWINRDGLNFDVIVLGAMTENQYIYPLLSQFPIDKLCSQPGYLFIWSSRQKISELAKLINNKRGWGKAFRPLEELVFVPVIDKKCAPKAAISTADLNDGPFPETTQEKQWHCWMCIKGPVYRKGALSRATGLQSDSPLSPNSPSPSSPSNAVPELIYKIAEDISTNKSRKLHIIPSHVGTKYPIKMRSGWVIMSPDVTINNFNVNDYKTDLERVNNNLKC